MPRVTRLASSSLAAATSKPAPPEEAGHEGLGAGTGDGAEIVDQFLLVHADAAVGHRQSVSGLVRNDADLRRLALPDQAGIGNGVIAQLVAGIRPIRDQFAEKDFGFRIDRMHHQMQQFGNFGLERPGQGSGVGGRHGAALRNEIGMWKARI